MCRLRFLCVSLLFCLLLLWLLLLLFGLRLRDRSEEVIQQETHRAAAGQQGEALSHTEHTRVSIAVVAGRREGERSG